MLRLNSEYGKEGVNNLRWCLSQGLVPVSIKLKSTVKTPKGTYIVRKVEKMLMNERVRVINNSITMFNCSIDTCINHLGRLLDKEVLEKCYRFILERREKRHIQTQKRQIKKFNRLWQRNTGGCSNLQHGRRGEGSPENNSKQDQQKKRKSNTENNTSVNITQQQQQQVKKWVNSLSNTPLTDAQEKVLAHGSQILLWLPMTHLLANT